MNFLIYNKMGFFSSIGNFFKKAASDIKGGLSHLYNSLDNKVNTIVNAVSSVPKVVDDVASKAISTVGGVANNVVDKGSSIIQTGEYTLILPLALIGVGLLFFLKNQSSNTISDVSKNASQVAPLAI
jgi:phage-related protein